MSLTDRIAANASRLHGLGGFPELRSERLLLRSPIEADLEPVFRLFADAAVVRFWSRPPMRNLGEAEAYLSSILDGWCKREFINWIVADTASDAMLGTCTLYDIQLKHLRCGIGYALLPEHQGLGYASEAVASAICWAFDYLDLHRIEADLHPLNEPSQRVLERNGFQREGLLRERFVHGEAIEDSLIYGLIAGDWRQRSKS